MDLSVIVNLVVDFVFQKVRESGLPISKSQVSMILGALLFIVIYFLGAFAYTSFNDVVVEERVEIEQTQTVIEDVKDTIETITPPNKNKIKDRVKNQVAKEQDNDASVF